MTRAVHFVGGPKNGDLEALDDPAPTQFHFHHEDGRISTYRMQIFEVDGHLVVAFVLHGLDRAAASLQLLKNCRQKR